MTFEFDPVKDAANRAKHGVSLLHGAKLFEDAAYIVIPSVRPIDGEDRYKAVGIIDGRLWTAVHVYRGHMVRIFSVRRSNPGEQRQYDRASG